MTIEIMTIPFLFLIQGIVPQFIAFVVVIALIGCIVYNILE